MELTLRWANVVETINFKTIKPYLELSKVGFIVIRTECMQRLEELSFEGLAPGGLSVGEKNEEMVEFCNDFVPTMPEDKQDT